MLKIAVCDDEIQSVQCIKTLIKDFFATKSISIDIQTYTNTNALLSSDINSFDIIYLDVDMGDKNGIEAAKEIRKTNTYAGIIYISSYVDYAMFGYEVKAYNYLLKSSLDKTFNTCMDKFMQEKFLQKETLNIKMNYENFKIPLCNIMYIESDKRILKLYTENMDLDIYTYYESMLNIDRQLSSKGFLRVQKSFLVNMNYINNISGYYATLNNGKKIKTTIRTYTEVLEKWAKWVGNN